MSAQPVCIVTGASGALGGAVASTLAERGHPLLLTARNEAALAELAGRLDAGLGKIVIDAGPLDGTSDARRVLAAAGSLGDVGVVVNAAGTFGPIGHPDEIPIEEFEQSIATNLTGPVSLSLAALAGMVERGWGRLVNVSSAQTLHPADPYVVSYATSKSALNFATRCLAARVAGTNVSACVIHPGNLRSAMWRDIRDHAERVGAQHLQTWAAQVDRTGGDDPQSAAALLVEIIERDGQWSNDRFLTIPGGFDCHPVPW